MHGLRENTCVPSPATCYKSSHLCGLQEVPWKKITFSLFNSQFLTFAAAELIVNPRCYEQSGKKLFHLICSTPRSLTTWNGRARGPFLEWHWADHFTRKARGLNEGRKRALFALELQFKSSGLQPIFQWVICQQDLQLYIQGQYH